MTNRILLIAFICILVFSGVKTEAQSAKDTFSLHNPVADASAELNIAIKSAKAENKHVLIQVGGNWCIWCKRFNAFTKNDASVDSLINANYIVYHLNYSKENKNLSVLKTLEYPQRFGFPVFVIPDGDGKRIHTQNSSLLESKETYYDKNDVMDFLKQWSPAAFNPELYLK